MGVIAEVTRSSTVAWAPAMAPNAYAIAAGTMAGSVDPSFESGSSLEILCVDLRNRTLVPIIAPVKSSERFHVVAWDGLGQQAGGGWGLIAGGMADGSVQIWDVNALSDPKTQADPSRALVFGRDNDQKRHDGQVLGLQFNSINPLLLSSGATDGEVRVWDLGSASGPSLHAFPIQRPGGKEEVTALAWNPKVQHILGNTSSAGMTDVWDLRDKKRPVISIRSPHGHPRCSDLAWNPEEATQVIVTTDDATANYAVLWDLRNSTSPIREYAHHRGGILSVSWSQFDADIVLTSGKDSRTVCFSPSMGDVLCEISSGSNWIHDIQWSPKLPGIFMTSSFDGQLSVMSILTPNLPHIPKDKEQSLANSFGMNASDFGTIKSPSFPSQSVEMKRAPKWLRKPAGMAFGFGGRIASFSREDGPRVSVSSAIFPSALIRENEKLERALQDPTSVREYVAEQKARNSDDPVFDILQLQLETDSRRKLIRYLGYSVEDGQAGDSTIGLEHSQGLVNVEEILQRQSSAAAALTPKLGGGSAGTQPVDGGTGGGLAQNMQELNLQGPAPWDIDNGGGSLLDSYDTKPFSSPTTTTGSDLLDSSDGGGAGGNHSAVDIEAVIKRAVVTGDFQRAVDKCLEVGRTADALVFAQCGGPELWMKTRSSFLSKHPQKIMSVVFRAVIDASASFEAVASYALSSPSAWKEVLAVFATYAPGPTFVNYCNRLADEVLAQGRVQEALECYVCAANVAGAAELWARKLAPSSEESGGTGKSTRTDRLWELVMRIRLLEAAKSLARGSRDLTSMKVEDETSASAYFEVAMILSGEGALTEATRYLSPLRADFHGAFGIAGEALQRAEKAAATKGASAAARQAAAQQPQPNQNQRQRQLPQQQMNTPYRGPGMGGPQGMVAQQPGMGAPYGQQPGPGYQPGYQPSMAPPPQQPMTASPMMGPARSTMMPPSAVPPQSGLAPLQPAPAMQQWSHLSPSVAPPPPPPGVSPVQPPPMNAMMPKPPSVAGAAQPVQPPMVSHFPGERRDGSFDSMSQQPPPPRQGPMTVAPPGPRRPPSVVGPGSVPFAAAPMQPPPQTTMPPSTFPPPPTGTQSPFAPRSATGSMGFSPSQGPVPSMDSGMDLPESQRLGPAAVPPPAVPPRISAVGTGLQSAFTPPTFNMMQPTPAQQAPAPPPPPSSGDEIPIVNYHANMRTGAGHRLPPSAEVAGMGGANRPASSTSSAKETVPVSLEDADTSSVPGDQQCIVASIRNTFAYVRDLNPSPMYRRKMEDTSRKLGRLLQMLNEGEIGAVEVGLLRTLSEALDQADYNSAHMVVQKLVVEHMDDGLERNSAWIVPLKRLINSAMSGH